MNLTSPLIESWFIPLNILMILCTGSTLILSMLFFLVIIFNKTYRTIPMMLVANSCLAELVFASDMLAMVLFTLQNDLKQIQSVDSFCIILGYLNYVGYAIQNSSFFLQSIYRYISVVYPTRFIWRSARFQVFLICLTWILGFIYPVPYLFTGEIQYNGDNQVCQVPLRLSILAIYNTFCVNTIPISLTMLTYFKLVRYVKEMSQGVTPVNTLFRAQRELKMIRRIVVLVLSILASGIPYSIMLVIAFFTTPPKYHFRIAFLCTDISLAFVIITLFQFTDPLKTLIKKKLPGRVNMILPAIA